jgi:hypothetical protein
MWQWTSAEFLIFHTLYEELHLVFQCSLINVINLLHSTTMLGAVHKTQATLSSTLDGTPLVGTSIVARRSNRMDGGVNDQA